MSQFYEIHCREEDREPPSVAKFNTLADASRYIQDRWQGPEYMDGIDGFHTDYSTYELIGFTLKEIGTLTWGGEAPHLYREFTFDNLSPK